MVVQHATPALRTRRLDHENQSPPYWQRDWFTLGQKRWAEQSAPSRPNSPRRSAWTAPYAGSDDHHTLMVSCVVPFTRNERFGGVVIQDVAVRSLFTFQSALQDLIPDVDDACQLVTADGELIAESPGFRTRTGSRHRSAIIRSTNWRLILAVSPSAE